MNERKEQNMTARPYPQTVVEAVAKALWDTAPASAVIDWEDIQPEDTRNRRSDYLEKAHAALSALWEASRVDSLEQLDALPNDAVLLDVTGVVADDYVTHCIVDLPARIIHWGDPV